MVLNANSQLIKTFVCPFTDANASLVYTSKVILNSNGKFKFVITHNKSITIYDEDQTVLSFLEKPRGDGSWINGGFFICEPKVFDYIEGDATIFEKEPMEQLAANGEMKAFNHIGFWKPMDTLRDKHELEESWVKNKAAWKTW